MSMLSETRLSVHIQERLKQLESMTVSFSMDHDQAPYMVLTFGFKTVQIAKAFFSEKNPFWRYINRSMRHYVVGETPRQFWDHSRVNGKTNELYVIYDDPKNVGTLQGRAHELLDCIENALVFHDCFVPTTVQPGVLPTSDFCFGLDEYINPDIREALGRTSKVTARRLFDANHVPFVGITVEFYTTEAAEFFYNKAAPFWKSYYDEVRKFESQKVVENYLIETAEAFCQRVVPSWKLYCDEMKKSQTQSRVEFYIIEDDPSSANMPKRAQDLLMQIEKHSRVTTEVFPNRISRQGIELYQ